MLRGRCGAVQIALGRMIHIRALELNQSRGWNGKDLTVLSRLHQLTCLKVASLNLENVDGLLSQSELQSLSLEVSDLCAGTIHWHQMGQLQKLTVPGRLLANVNVEMPGLEDLYIYTSCGDTEDRILSHFPNLRSLRLNFSNRTDLQNISAPNLQRLKLGGAMKLKNLRGAEKLDRIEQLTLVGCKSVESIEDVIALEKLKELHLVECSSIPSIAFLRTLPHLQRLTFPATRVLDGDVACLMTFPSLMDVDFDNCKDYNGNREEVLRNLNRR